MTYNYNAAMFVKDSDMSKENENNLAELTSQSRCNGCRYFNFGKRLCEKKSETGKYVRRSMIPITYSEQTKKGIFIHVLKPVDCHDFTPKNIKTKLTMEERSNEGS